MTMSFYCSRKSRSMSWVPWEHAMPVDGPAWEKAGWPDPTGLLQGLWGVLVGHAAVMLYYLFRRWRDKECMYAESPKKPSYLQGMKTHFSKPEGITMVFGYLCSVWMFRLMPQSYYNLTEPLRWQNVAAQFVVVDFFIYLMHLFEHMWRPLYRKSHKALHFFLNPTLFNAFDGAFADTFGLILIPLISMAWVLPLVFGVQVHHADFACFGCIYANQFMLIHSEYRNPWDWFLEMLSIGTSADHAVHHICFTKNYGHFFMWYDKAFGTYRAPSSVPSLWLHPETGCLKVRDEAAAVPAPEKGPATASAARATPKPRSTTPRRR